MSVKRMIDSVRFAWQHRRALAEVAKDHRLENVCMLTPAVLSARGCQYLLLDFDGVLASHGKLTPDEDVHAWLTCLQNEFSGHVLIYSNKPTPERMVALKASFPEIDWVCGKRKKPYPDGFERFLSRYQCAPSACVMIDDRLLTGVLGAVMVDVPTLWLTHPRTSFSNSPIKEGFFMVMRAFDRMLISVLRYF